MNEIYRETMENGDIVFHRNYCLYHYGKMTAFDAGVIRLITLDFDATPASAAVCVFFEDGSRAEWTTKWISSYNFQFGIAVSFDGKCVFVQTWENGLFCLDARTGEKLWRTKSRRGITGIFVNDNTLLCHQRERALQLIDIHTGEVLAEKRPAVDWGFTAIGHKTVVCGVRARRWEVIDAETLETKLAFTHKQFTGGHENYRINHIAMDGSEMVVRGFKNVWDETVSPAVMLPNLEFEHRFSVDLEA